MENISKQQIEALVEWLTPRLGPLILHGAKVREVLEAAQNPEAILQSAMELVTAGEESISPDLPLTPEQLAVWNAMLPLLAEHGLMAVHGNSPSLEPDRPMTKEEAADYLGIGVRKLELCMKKRQIAYGKFGAGKTAAVRFHRIELDRYRASRTVAAKQNRG